MATRPNILYLHSHDTGRYVQPYGHAVSTPHLQRLAEEGVLFRRAFCAAPTCSPSRAALLTGQCAHSSGMLGLAHLGFALHDARQHLLHTLRDAAGYQAVLVGIQHLERQSGDEVRDGTALGYDRVIPRGEDNAAQAAEFLRGAPADQPFFLDVGFFETHRYGKQGGVFNPAGRQGDGRSCLPPAPLPDAPQVRQDVADYRVAAARLDAKVGVILDALDETGLAANTLVVCTTDHGPPFPGMKCNLTDHGIGVMLLVRGPGGFTGGRAIDALVSHVDVFPTVCDLLAIPPPAWLQGRSLLPLVRGEVDEVNEAVFAEVSYHAAYEPQRAVRTRRWKYIRRFGDRRRPVLANCDGGPSKDLWLAHGWRERPVDEEQLHDLVFDPHEADNRAADPALAPVLAELRGRLAGWMEATADPLLRGPVPPPPGARVRDPDGLSTQERGAAR